MRFPDDQKETRQTLQTLQAGTPRIAESDAGAPVLDAYVTADGISSRIWCAWCRRWHSHGHCDPSAPLGAGDGHRVAHCHTPSSPLQLDRLPAA